jgi:hypothetical protein
MRNTKMNERIRELYRQAHSIRRYDGDPALDGNPPTVYWQGEASAQRFADLIVRECMALCKTSVGNADYNTGRLHCLENIKEHFGVE